VILIESENDSQLFAFIFYLLKLLKLNICLISLQVLFTGCVSRSTRDEIPHDLFSSNETCVWKDDRHVASVTGDFEF